MELDFRREPRLLTAVIDELAVGLVSLDATGNVMAWNRGAEKIAGYGSFEVVGRPSRMFEGPGCSAFSFVRDLIAHETTASGREAQRVRMIAKGGLELNIHAIARAVRDERGRTGGAIVTFHPTAAIDSSVGLPSLSDATAVEAAALRQLVGESDVIREVVYRLRLAAQSDLSLQILGEPGTGKELAARIVHALSGRAGQAFSAVNCEAVPELLLEGELFGHTIGAFPGAAREKVGAMRSADGGTLYLDELGALSPLVQLKLLRALDERQVRRLGDDQLFKSDVRLVTATMHDPAELVQSGRVRAEFLERSRGFVVRMPALRERRQDIPLLVEHFLKVLSRRPGGVEFTIARDALMRLVEFSWPGNVAQLRSVLEQSVLTAAHGRIAVVDLPPEIREITAPNRETPRRRGPSDPTAQREELVEALRTTNGNRAAAARLLGVSRVTMWKRLRKYGLK